MYDTLSDNNNNLQVMLPITVGGVANYIHAPSLSWIVTVGTSGVTVTRLPILPCQQGQDPSLL